VNLARSKTNQNRTGLAGLVRQANAAVLVFVKARGIAMNRGVRIE
jgi:hypothetical protein